MSTLGFISCIKTRTASKALKDNGADSDYDDDDYDDFDNFDTDESIDFEISEDAADEIKDKAEDVVEDIKDAAEDIADDLKD